jgi:hypothetical protein
VLAIQAVAIAVALVWLPGALDAKSLIVGNIGREAAHFVKRQSHAFQQRNKLLEVILPTEPSAMSCV